MSRAGFLGADLPSEDEEDQDYVPDEADVEARAAGKKKKPKRVRGAALGAGGPEEEEEAEGDEGGGDELEDMLPASKREAKKAKVDALWSQLHKGPTAGGGASLAALCKPVTKKAGKGGGGDQSWMRQLGLGPKPKQQVQQAQQAQEPQEPSDAKKVMAAAALAAAKAAASATAAAQYGTVVVAEQRRFAGQTITVNKEVARDSKEAQRAAEAATGGGNDAAARNKAGLDKVLESLAQAKKVTVLDKSRADWKDFKKGDEAVEEELEMHKRSGAQYLDRQAFLKQAELREYEIERDRRLASDVRNRGRL
eukprot:scaffold8.g1534.t1